MKNLMIIYNPNSGNKTFKFELDVCIEKFQKSGYSVSFLRAEDLDCVENHFKQIKKDSYDAFVVSGGDGTINIVINALMKYDLNHIPIGFIPSGTANDFSTFLNLPKKIEDACDIILQNKTISVDVGLANDKYFINVCAGGLFANVGQKIKKDFKEAFGKLAYYAKAVEEINHYKPIRLKIVNSKETIEDDFILFLVLNTSGTGGIEKISPSASITDGFFDFVAFKAFGFSKLAGLTLNFLKGEYLEDDGVLFFRDKEIFIENLSEENITTDLDGEFGHSLPVKIKNINKCIKIFYNEKENKNEL